MRSKMEMCVWGEVVNVPARQRQNGPYALGSRRLRLDRLFRSFLVRWIVCLDPRTYSLHLRLQRSHTSHAYAAFPKISTNTSIEHKREISNQKPERISQRETIRGLQGGEIKERAFGGKYMRHSTPLPPILDQLANPHLAIIKRSRILQPPRPVQDNLRSAI